MELHRIEGAFEWGPDDGCEHRHLHAAVPEEGIRIDGQGPFPDPDRHGCGYGPILTVSRYDPDR